MKLSLQYIAGFFDGEGCIDNCYSKNYSSRLRITQKAKTILLKIKKTFGFGYVYCDRCGKKYCENSFHVWRYEVKAKSARIILRLLLPYLVVKKKQAQIELAKWDKSHKRL